jgi:homocitrate synthase NifV
MAYAEQLATAIDDAQAERILPLVRRFVTQTKHAPEDTDLRRFLDELAASTPLPPSALTAPAVAEPA